MAKIYLAILMIAVGMLSSCDVEEPHWAEGHDKYEDIEIEPMDLTPTLKEDVDIYDEWDLLDMISFEKKVVKPLGILDK